MDLIAEFGDQALPLYWAGFILVGDGPVGSPFCPTGSIEVFGSHPGAGVVGFPRERDGANSVAPQRHSFAPDSGGLFE